MNKTSHFFCRVLRNKHRFQPVIGKNLPPGILPNLTGRRDDCVLQIQNVSHLVCSSAQDILQPPPLYDKHSVYYLQHINGNAMEYVSRTKHKDAFKSSLFKSMYVRFPMRADLLSRSSTTRHVPLTAFHSSHELLHVKSSPLYFCHSTVLIWWPIVGSCTNIF